MYIEWHDPGEPVATRPCGEGMGVHVFPVLPYIFTNWPGCNDGHGRQKGRERGGRSSRNHSRENKHQIAYAQRPGGHGPRRSYAPHRRFLQRTQYPTPAIPFMGCASPPTATCLSAQSVKGDRASRRIMRRQGPGKATATRSFSLFPIVCLSRSSLAPQLST